MWSGISIKSIKEKPQPLEDSVLLKKLPRKITKQTDDCISVFCRIRPLQPSQESNKSLAIATEENSIELVADGLGRPINKKYTFTQLFVSDPQADVIKRLCDPILAAVQQECKGGLIFAYGVTSSGKTHTILGTDTEPGILQYLFKEIPKPFSLTAVQVYNDQFFPLVGPKNKINLIESCGRLQFKNHQALEVTFDNMDSLIEEIKSNRAQRGTNYNSKSSRSHAIFRIVSQGKVIGVVDLAGSERVREGCSSEETTNINKSLLTLGRCIKCLREMKADRAMQIPFRECRLTMALAQYFNQDFKLVMVVNINQAKSLMSQTVNVLEYAAIAKDIRPNNTPTKSRFKNIAYSQTRSESRLGALEECKSYDFQTKSALAQTGKHRFNLELKFVSENRDIMLPRRVINEPNKVLRDYIIQNNLHLLKKQYYQRHKILNDDFNIFFEKEIQEDNDRDEQFLKRLKEPSVITYEEKQTRAVPTTSTCINTIPIPQPKLQSAFKRKTHEEYQHEYREWLVAEKAKFTNELQQEAMRRQILERMYQDEMDELKHTRDNAQMLEAKLDQEIRKRDKMELDVQDQIRNEAELQKSVFQQQLEYQREQIKIKLQQEYLMRKEFEKNAEQRIMKIMKEKKQYEKKDNDQRQQLIDKIYEMMKKHDEAKIHVEEFKKRALNQNDCVIQTDDINRSSIKQKNTNQNNNEQNIRQRESAAQLTQQKGKDSMSQTIKLSISNQKNIEEQNKKGKSKASNYRGKYKSLNRKQSAAKQEDIEDKEDNLESSDKKYEKQKKKKSRYAKSVRFEDTRDPTPLKMRLRPRSRNK